MQGTIGKGPSRTKVSSGGRCWGDELSQPEPRPTPGSSAGQGQRKAKLPPASRKTQLKSGNRLVEGLPLRRASYSLHCDNIQTYVVSLGV